MHATLAMRRLMPGLVISATLLVLGLAASPADAASWSRSTAGASASGTVYKANGYGYNRLTIRDTAADGNCVYATTNWRKYAWFPGLGYNWSPFFSADRTNVCGYGQSVTVYHRGEPGAYTQWLQASTRVCRNDSWGVDKCSNYYYENLPY